MTYPFRANPSYGLFLVNGQPRVINAEDLSLLDQKGLQVSFQFLDLKNQFPKAAIYPGGSRRQDLAKLCQTKRERRLAVRDRLSALRQSVNHALTQSSARCSNGFSSPSGKFTGTSFFGAMTASAAETSQRRCSP